MQAVAMETVTSSMPQMAIYDRNRQYYSNVSGSIPPYMLPLNRLDIHEQYREQNNISILQKAALFCCIYSAATIGFPTYTLDDDVQNEMLLASHGYILRHSHDTKSLNSNMHIYENINTNNMLQQVKNTFKFSITDLSRLANISRPTIYNYLKDKDTVPMDGTRGRVEILHKYALQFQKVFPDYTDRHHLIKRPIFDGQSLFEFMQRGDEISSQLEILRELYIKEKTNGRETVAIVAAKPMITLEDEVSVILYRE
jgi:predicted transcriptional regulator